MPDRYLAYNCRVCFKDGHIQKYCPNVLALQARQVKETALVVYGEDDVEDSSPDIEYEADYVVNSVRVGNMSEAGSMLVLLDNQASRSVFHNAELLHSIGPLAEPYYLGGIKSDDAGILVDRAGSLPGLSGVDGEIGYTECATANVLSWSRLIDSNYKLVYVPETDVFELGLDSGATLTFMRRPGSAMHYTCDMTDYVVTPAEKEKHSALVATVADNLKNYNKRDIAAAACAKQLGESLGHWPARAVMELISNGGIVNCPVVVQDVLRSVHIWGQPVARLKGATHKQTPRAAQSTIVPRVTQEEQNMSVDVMFVKGLPFLLGVLSPLGVGLCVPLRDRGTECVREGLESFCALSARQGFTVCTIFVDGEKSIWKMRHELGLQNIELDQSGPGQHAPIVEVRIKTVKERARAFYNTLPYVMPVEMIRALVPFVVRSINMQLSSVSSTVKISPWEQFTGRKIDFKRDLRACFGAYVQATVPNTDNTMNPRTTGCIALGSSGNRQGSVKMLALRNWEIISRDQFTVLPMPDTVAHLLTDRATSQGFARESEETEEHSTARVSDSDDSDISKGELAAGLPNMIDIDGRVTESSGELLPAVEPVAAEVGVNIASNRDDGSAAIDGDTAPEQLSANAAAANKFMSDMGTRWSTRSRRPVIRYTDTMSGPDRATTLVIHSSADHARACVRRHLLHRKDWRDRDFAFKISVRMALKERGAEAEPVIMAELQQMMDKGVWHGVHVRGLTSAERKAIIRSSMFLKDKYFASGAFEKFKARLVAGGDGQDKSLYEDLSSPTAATTSVFAIAAIAAQEHRLVEITDIGGAFLNASMKKTGVKVRMRLDKFMTKMLLRIDPSYEQYLEGNGETLVVELDKALYGCVEAAKLWYDDLRAKLEAYGFIQNPYDACVFNKTGSGGKQITIVFHVDDLMITSESQADLNDFNVYLRSVYPETKTKRGTVLDYLGMTFDFTTKGEVRVTMDHAIEEILRGCGVETVRATPACSFLFETRDDAVKATEEEAGWFHSYTARLQYIAKRVRPECLTAVSFLVTRVQVCDVDDLAKLRRLLGYLRGTKNRGIVLRVGDSVVVRAYIDAAYGVHQDSGRSHSGCVIVLGEAGPSYAKSSKQKIVTKSSTEAELVATSDAASQVILFRNFVEAQGYETGPAVIYQDNMSCMALIKRGGPASERSRHINIRHFWLAERVKDKEVIVEHLGTEDMFANALTKPVQGKQFATERLGLTNWN